MNRNLYRKLAKKHGVPASEIRREMQSALTAAYESPNLTPETLRAQSAVLRTGDAPTPEEFIRHAVREVLRRTETD